MAQSSRLTAWDVLISINPRPLHKVKEDPALFSENHGIRLAHIFSDQAGNADRSAFLFQPESILILEYLKAAVGA
jgi:hypothetical protein